MVKASAGKAENAAGGQKLSAAGAALLSASPTAVLASLLTGPLLKAHPHHGRSLIKNCDTEMNLAHS